MRTIFTKCLAVVTFFLLGAGTMYAQLSGSYTIDPNGSGSNNYTSVSAAATALGSNGVSGAVTFTIESGTYNGQVSINSAITGASSTNTIKFIGKSGNRGDVIIASTGTYALYLLSVDYVTFEDLTVQHSGTYGIYLRSNADNNTFDNVRVTYTGTGRGYNIYNYQSEFNTFNDCYVENGYYGIYNWGWNTSTRQEGTTISNSEFYNQTYYGIYSYYGEDLVMDNVVLDSFSGNFPLYVMYGVSTTLANSKIIAPSMGSYAYWYYNNYYGSSTDESNVYNNMLVLHGTFYGMYAYNMYRNNWHNNSISMKGSSYGAYMPYADGSEFYNNNWYADGGTYGMYMYHNGTIPAMDYNNLDWNGTYWGVLGTYAFTSLAQQQGQYSAINPNSLDVDPEFETATNLRTYASSLNNKGTKKSILTKDKDIDGNKRPATGDTKYDIGCNEYYLSPSDLDVKAVVSPTSVSTNANTITANFKNTGSQKLTSQPVTFQYSVDSGATWTGTENDTVTLDPGKSYNFTFTQTWTPTRTGDFRVGIRISKQVANDPDTKDETYVDICSGLAGTFTVGRASSDFPTLADAFKKLECGLAGHTTFQLAGGNGGTQATYGQIRLHNVMGTSASATLTIDGQSPDSVRVTHTSGSSYDGAIDIRNSDFMIVKNMEVRHNPNYVGVLISGGADNNTVENLDVACTQSSYYMSAGLAMTGASYSTATDVDNNLVKNCSFKGTYYGANLRSGTGGSYNNTIEGCTFDDFYYYGMYLRYQDSLSLIGNEVVKNGNIYQYGYNTYTYYNTRSNIVGNYLEGHSYGGLFMYYENNGTSYRSLVANNIINGKGYYCTYGYVALDIYYYSRNVDVYHNTAISDPCGSTTNIGFGQNAAMRMYYTTDCNVKNNILLSLDNSGSGVPFIDYYSFTLGDFDYNTFITNTGNIATQNTSSISSLSALQSTYTGKNLNSNDDAVTFVGSGDYHLTTAKDSRRAPAIAGITTDIDNDTRCAFAASIGADESNYPTPKTRAFFAVDDTVFVNSATQFSNAYKTTDPVVNNWYVDGNYAGSTVDLEHRFRATGTYTVKVITEGCGGLDSFNRSVVVVLPTKAPSVGFLTSNTIIDVNDIVSFKNITTDGPDSFFWKVDSFFKTGQFGFKVRSHDFVNGTDSNSTDPQIEFLYPGSYTVCLHAYNIRGKDSTCKMAHITVRQTADMCGIDDFSTNLIGKLFDEGGASGSYVANRQLCTYLIDPCTDEIKLTFNEFNLASGSVLRIYDGKNNLGKPLYDYDPAFANGLTGDMTKLTNFKKNLTATSGEVYVEFTSGGTVASGFELEWKGNAITATTPVVDFGLQDTVCAGVPFAVMNSTQGLDVDYVWTMDTSASNWFSGGDYDTEDITHKYDTAGTYAVKLYGGNCGGEDSLVKTIVVVAPTNAPTPSFSVSNSRPAIGDAVTFTDLSTSGNFPCIGDWEWSVSPSTFSFAGGFNANSRNPQIFFQDTGYYDVTLKVTNSAGSNSYTMTQAVYSISICIPSVKITGTKVGISRVVIGDIDNSSDINEDGYENFTSTASTGLEKGASYDITIERPGGGTNPMNRAVWVDYNQDGAFDNATEMVVSSTADNNQTWTGNFSVPTTAINGPTRLRVGVNLGNFKQYGCGPNQFGEFEDYRVYVTDDSKAPVIVFVGSQDTTIEQCSNWADPGAYGWDNVDDSVGLTSTVSGVDVSTAGTYTIVYKAEDKSTNEGQGTRTVTVVTDYTNPVLTMKGNNPETIEVKSTYTDAGADADDNCGGDITADIVVSGSVDNTTLGTYFITYDIKDVAGNSASMTREVKVVDTQAPVATLDGKATDTVEVHTAYIEAGVSSTDNYDLVLDYVVTGTVDVNTLGTYELKYTVTDASGNVSNELTRTVVVADRTAPLLRMALGDESVTVTIEVNSKYQTEYIDIDDNYESESVIRNTMTFGGTYFENFGTGNADVIGTYTFSYTAEDGSGNSTTVTRTIEVVDTEAPVITFGNGNSVVIPRWGEYVGDDVSASDNYDAQADITIREVENTVDKNSTGTYYVKYEAEDKSGNIGTAVRAVIVAETEETVGVGEANIAAEIYPNPTNGQLNINVDLLKAGRVRVSVINSLGQEVVTVADQMAHTVNKTVDLSTLGSGVYYIQIVSGNDRLIEKVTLTD